MTDRIRDLRERHPHVDDLQAFTGQGKPPEPPQPGVNRRDTCARTYTFDNLRDKS